MNASTTTAMMPTRLRDVRRRRLGRLVGAVMAASLPGVPHAAGSGTSRFVPHENAPASTVRGGVALPRRELVARTGRARQRVVVAVRARAVGVVDQPAQRSAGRDGRDGADPKGGRDVIAGDLFDPLRL